jgi:hypothetical protein
MLYGILNGVVSSLWEVLTVMLTCEVQLYAIKRKTIRKLENITGGKQVLKFSPIDIG